MHSVAEALIRSIRVKPPGGIMRFMASRTGSPHDGRFGVELFVDHAALRRAAVLAVRLESQRLGGLPLSDVTRLLIRTLQDGLSR